MTAPDALPPALATRLEKLPVQVHHDAARACEAVAREIAELIQQRRQQGTTCVLGLATGSTPRGVYAELIRMHRQQGLSFRNVVAFNLDEYYPMSPDALQSYRRFMREQLFDHIDIPPEQVHIPDGTLPIEQVAEHCEAYERKIAQAGGIDLLILGLGRTGHIGFNEPGSSPDSRTRLISLDRVTRMDAASDFFGAESVPRRGITMGVGTIMDARRLVLLAFGEHKAAIVAQSVEGQITSNAPSTYLQKHPNATVVLDPAASGELTRFKHPWRLGPIQWSQRRIRQATLWLSLKRDTPILKLTDEDYNEAGLQDLLAEHGPAYRLNLEVFRQLQQTITGWPAGKPEHLRRPGDIRRPFDDVFPKRIVVFSPHPDDDVISMGGTLMRLVDHGHEVHVAYQTSGSIAVFDDDAIRFADFAAEFNALFGIDEQQTRKMSQHIEQFLKNKQPGQIDSEQVLKLKALIRRGEARAAARFCGIPLDRLHFLDLPFYETGTVSKRPLGEADIAIVRRLLQEIQPHQIYAAGDLSDPHGTHRVCLNAVMQALDGVSQEQWFSQCEVWLYRGAWMEWEPASIDMAVPLSPHELHRKRDAIFKHESQKDKALFPGTDPREFWQRAEDRNRATAKLYDRLGMAEYEAVEGFVRWSGEIQP